jgi:hypothetical protein
MHIVMAQAQTQIHQRTNKIKCNKEMPIISLTHARMHTRTHMHTCTQTNSYGHTSLHASCPWTIAQTIRRGSNTTPFPRPDTHNTEPTLRHRPKICAYMGVRGVLGKGEFDHVKCHQAQGTNDVLPLPHTHTHTHTHTQHALGNNNKTCETHRRSTNQKKTINFKKMNRTAADGKGTLHSGGPRCAVTLSATIRFQ